MSHRRLQRGMTLIELMVTLLIAMVMSLALFSILASAEGRKRVSTGLNDAEQSGQLALYLLDQWGRSAGSGFAAQASTAYGCSLHARAASGQTLPLTGSLPAPFAAVNPGSGAFALAPALILPGQTTPSASGKASDVLVLMGGTAGLGGAPLLMNSAPGTSTLALKNGLAVAANDLLLLVDPSAGSAAPCLVTQAASVSGGSVTLGGSFYAATIADLGLGNLSTDTVALPLGNPGSNAPQFLLVGVGDHDTLYSYDLLQTGGASQALAARVQGVFELHAVYGVDADGDGKVDSWVSPSSGSYAYANLAAGGATANALLQKIKEIRVALILRVPLKEKAADAPSPGSLSWFADLSAYGLAGSRSLSSEEQRYRYRVVESTLVLRNNLMLSN